MTDVSAGKNENFENLLKRFNRKVNQEGILSELKHSGYYEKPSLKRKRRNHHKNGNRPEDRND